MRTDYQHGLRIGNPVYFVTIDGEIAREIEGPNLSSEVKTAFKKKLRHALAIMPTLTANRYPSPLTANR